MAEQRLLKELLARYGVEQDEIAFWLTVNTLLTCSAYVTLLGATIVLANRVMIQLR